MVKYSGWVSTSHERQMLREARAAVLRVYRQGIPDSEIQEALTLARNIAYMDIEVADWVTLKEASERFDIPYGTLRHWVRKGHLVMLKREKYPARGGGKILVSSDEVAEVKDYPPKAGRPRAITSAPA